MPPTEPAAQPIAAAGPDDVEPDDVEPDDMEPDDDLPAGHTWRRAALDDAPAAARLVAGYDVAHTGESAGAEADIAADLASSEIDLATGSWLVQDDAGAPAGLAAVYVDRTARHVYIDVYVLPQGEHAAALAGWLVGRAVAQAAAEAATEGGDGWTVGAGCYQCDGVIAGALRGAGLGRVRTFLRYRVDHDPVAAPAAVDPGPGVAVRRIRAAGEPGHLDDLRALHHVLDTSFLDHYHPQARSYEEWLAYQREASGYAPHQWWLAEVDGAPAGGLIGSDRLADAARVPRPGRRHGAAAGRVRRRRRPRPDRHRARGRLRVADRGDAPVRLGGHVPGQSHRLLRAGPLNVSTESCPGTSG